jgi:hypothetical protein
MAAVVLRSYVLVCSGNPWNLGVDRLRDRHSRSAPHGMTEHVPCHVLEMGVHQYVISQDSVVVQGN